MLYLSKAIIEAKPDYYLKQLVDIGLLKEVKVGREKLFINPSLLKAPRSTE